MNEIFWIKVNPPPPLAVVLKPYGDDKLEGDLLRIKQGGIQTLVSHLTEKEVVLLGLEEEASVAERLGMEFLLYPIPDTHCPPDPDSFRIFVEELVSRLRAGIRIGIHCRGSIGRSTVTAACALIHLGWKPKEALKAIEAARELDVPDTKEQKDWILRYKARR